MGEKTKYRPISIIITAYKASAFIEDCLDSIEAQTYFENNDKYEILLGIDACPETLQKVKIIGHKYRNLRVFMMEKNVGTYVTSNTLLDIAQYPNIIRFDSDDIMLPEMVEEILQHSEEYDLIQYGFKTFTTRKEDAKETHYWPACGSVFYKKSFIIDAAGGYRDWKCSADLELLKRTQNYPHKRHKIEKRLFLLRSHPNSLGNSEYTKLRGHYRKGVESKIRILPANQDPKIEKRISDYKEIDFNLRDLKETFSTGTAQIIKRESLRSNFGISIIITAWKTANYIEQCLDSIESQSYFINNNNYEILLGIDGCQETLAKVKEIMEKYRNLRVFMMEENVGTYVTTNTLLDLVSYDNIIRFDSDDYMLSDMISEVMAASEEYDFIRFHFDDFDEVRKQMRPRAFLAMGAVYYKKWVIEKAGGYKDWRCNADLELLKRISNSDIRFGEIKRPLFVRRIHPNSLSEREETGIRSFFRKNLTNRVRIYDKGEDIKIERVVGKYKEIKDFSISQVKNKKLRILIVNLNNLNYTKNCINDLLDQINKNFDILLIDQNSSESGTEEYLKYLEKNTNIKITRNKENVDLNRIWDSFAKNSNSEYLCFLNNDVRLTNNFTDDIINLFEKEKNVGISIHVTNNLSYTRAKQEIHYEILNNPLCQGWDFSIRKELYEEIPLSLKIFGGDDFIFSSITKRGYSVGMIYSSPVIHYKERTRIILGEKTEKIQKEDSITFRRQEIIKRNLKIVPSSTGSKICNKYPPENIQLTQNKNCIYTALIGNYDKLETSLYEKKDNWDYICFTDLDIESDFWKIIKIENNGNTLLDNYKLARHYKIKFYNNLLSYNNLIWKDSRMIINCDLDEYFKNINDSDILFMKHGEANNIKEEFKRILELKLERDEIIEKIEKKYENEGYKYDNGLFATGLIAFKNNERTIHFFRDWWNEINKLSYRDQLSCNYALFKNPYLKYSTLPENIVRNESGFFKPGKRKSKRLKF